MKTWDWGHVTIAACYALGMVAVILPQAGAVLHGGLTPVAGLWLIGIGTATAAAVRGFFKNPPKSAAEAFDAGESAVKTTTTTTTTTTQKDPSA